MQYQLAQSFTLLSYISSSSGFLTPTAVHSSLLITLISVALCRARILSFCIRKKQLPPEVKSLFGGFSPSDHHGVRMCKILRSEWQRQARLHRDTLNLQLHHNERLPAGRRKRWREYNNLIDSTVEHMWQCALRQLRIVQPTRPRQEGVVHVADDVQLSEQVRRTLGLGPKFAVEQRKTPAELLSVVRQVSSLAPTNECDRCVSEGVDVLMHGKPTSHNLPLKKVSTFLLRNELCVVPADKEGGFAVLPNDVYLQKAHDAVLSVFKRCPDVSLAKVKEKAILLCSQLDLKKLALTIGKCQNLALDMFFSCKTHKEDSPFRVIISEKGTWQKALASFIQQNLKLLKIDDPFLIRNSQEVISFINQNPNEQLTAFSIDVKDLYYSLPSKELISCIEECIDEFGSVAFQNTTCISGGAFLDLVSFYLKSTYVEWNNEIFLQKNGVSIGSCIAPLLSDLYLAKLDRALNARLNGSSVLKTFRFVDDYLVILKRQAQCR
ncbi:uncharacterized protein LOC142786889 [Rhipicephalus microplus]|uniref:uncharacterized protein LOC142786889 n=1 Tax=Rhipicephalus microplus TaxID=6941 RepID=UPI003F6AFA9A